ncbi:T9SS type A sorting domain-containing protein [Muribaculum intestinale]
MPLVEVFDISGKRVFSGCGSMVSGLAKGIYIVKVKTEVVKVRI